MVVGSLGADPTHKARRKHSGTLNNQHFPFPVLFLRLPITLSTLYSKPIVLLAFLIATALKPAASSVFDSMAPTKFLPVIENCIR